MKPVFVMSPPHCSRNHAHDPTCAFQVAWSINPHMNGSLVDPALAARQYQELKETFVESGVRVVELPFIRSAYDSVFTKDIALLFSDGESETAILTNPRFAQRRMELEARKRELRVLGFKVIRNDEHCFEGGDVVMRPGMEEAFLGHGFRSSPEAKAFLEKATGRRIVTLKLRDPYLYHLDTALVALSDGWVLACREAFTPDAWSRLRGHVETGKLVEIPRSEAINFGANLVQVGQNIICGSFVPHTFAALKRLGFTPVFSPLTEFQRAGGSAACLVAQIHPLRIKMPTAAMRSTLEYAG